jgi:transcriptional regulator with XRE-family HTH domain
MHEAGALRTDRLKAIREQYGWSQRELSRLCGFGVTTVGKCEKGLVDPTATHLRVITDKLDVSIDYLLGASDDPRRGFAVENLSDEESQMLKAFRRAGPACSTLAQNEWRSRAPYAQINPRINLQGSTWKRL